MAVPIPPPEEQGDLDHHQVDAPLLELYEILEWAEATK